jgi:hypothetical protein
MLGIFKSKWDRAVTAVADFIPKMLEPHGKIPAAALRDPYCIGFLQIVGVHVASQHLESGSGMEKAMAVFEEALKQFAPRHASEVAELLPLIRLETSKHNETYLSGRKDGDLYMGWKLLHVAPQSHAEPALERFFGRVRHLESPPPAPQPEVRKPAVPEPQRPPAAQTAPAPSSGTQMWRVWIDMECSTMALMKDFMAAGDLLQMFAGAVFALQQDTLLMYSVDMWKTDDTLMNAVMDRMRPSRHGDFPERLVLVLKALYAIDNANLDVTENRVPPPGVSQQEHTAKIIIASMRSQAARVWLMTINSKIENSDAAQIKLGVMTMWLMLQAVPGAIAAKEALNFSGDYYNNVRTERFHPGTWPQNSMET